MFFMVTGAYLFFRKKGLMGACSNNVERFVHDVICPAQILARFTFTRGAVMRLLTASNTQVLPAPAGPTTKTERWWQSAACRILSTTASIA